MGKYVLYKENGDYKFTNEANYGARITDANRIATFKVSDGFENANDVIEYICRYSRDVSPEDIRIVTSESESRFNGLVDQIDVLSNMVSESGSLSPDQRAQLVELRDQVASFGERGAKWAELCDEIIRTYSPQLESMMEFYAKFVGSFDCPPVLAEAAMKSFKEILVESSASSNMAEQLRQRVGVNPNETQGIGVFGLSGDDNLPQQTTIDNEIANSMAAGTFDALGDDIATTDPNNVDETAMGLGSSEADTSGNDLNPDDWAAPAEEPAPEGGDSGTEAPEGSGEEPVMDEGGSSEETNTAEDDSGLETLDL